jgi:hypothetical protein
MKKTKIFDLVVEFFHHSRRSLVASTVFYCLKTKAKDYAYFLLYIIGGRPQGFAPTGKNPRGLPNEDFTPFYSAFIPTTQKTVVVKYLKSNNNNSFLCFFPCFKIAKGFGFLCFGYNFSNNLPRI